MMQFLSELRFAIRAVRRQPGIALIAMLAFGLGIGLPAAMFSITRGVATRGLPVEQGDRIMHLERRPHGRTGEGWGAAPRDFVAWRDQQSTFEQLAAFTTETVAVRIDVGAERYEAASMSANAFDLLRVDPVAGRAFQAGDDQPGAPPVAVLGHKLWTERFGASNDAIGRTIFIDGTAHTIVGVMPAGFAFPLQQHLWMPLVLPLDAATAEDPNLGVFGRLGDGISRDAAIAEFAIIAARVEQQFPESNADMGVTVKPFTEQHLGETPMRQMKVMMVAVLLVLLVACMNVASLLLVRAVHRVRELAVRAALGAGRRRIVTQLLLESTVMAFTGGILGVGVAAAAVGGLRRWLSADRLPFWVDMRLDGQTVVYALVLTFAAGLIAGALPAIKATGTDVIKMLKDESRGGSSLRIGRIMQGLITLEIALSLGLLVATGLMLQSLRNVRDVWLGFDTEATITAQLGLPESYDTDQRRRFISELEGRLADQPAAESFTIASNMPVTRTGYSRTALEGVAYDDENSMPAMRRIAVSPGFFQTFGADIRPGRSFGPADGPDSEPVAIINRQAAQRYFQGEDPIGRRIRTGGENSADEWRTIVGISPDLWANGLDSSSDRNPPAVYVPITQSPARVLSVAVLTRGPVARMAQAIREAAGAIDTEVPVYDIKDMGEVVEDNSWFFAFGASIVAAAGFSALVLAAIGLYGVIAFSVGRRTREIGIRMAVGATPNGIVTMVLWRGMWQIGIGVAMGLVLAFVLGSGVSGLLFEVNPGDPVVFTTFAAILIAIALIATLIPARRAARIDPLTALHAD